MLEVGAEKSTGKDYVPPQDTWKQSCTSKLFSTADDVVIYIVWSLRLRCEPIRPINMPYNSLLDGSEGGVVCGVAWRPPASCFGLWLTTILAQKSWDLALYGGKAGWLTDVSTADY